MGVYYRFEPGDVQHGVTYATPRIVLASGTLGPGGAVLGWRGNVGPSASLSLHEGIRGRLDLAGTGLTVAPIPRGGSPGLDGVTYFSGSYPATGSVRFVKLRIPTMDVPGTDSDWYGEHWAPIGLLYDYYSAVNPRAYFTGSYDFYSLYLRQATSFLARAVYFSGSTLSTVTSSFTLEAWINPTSVTGSRDFTIMSQRQRWRLYVAGATGRLAFSDFASTVSSSYSPTVGQWQHVAVVVDGGSASFYVGSSLVGTASYTGSLAAYAGQYLATGSFLTVGAQLSSSASVPAYDQGFSGFIFETRAWDIARTLTQVSAALGSTLVDSGSRGLRHYSRFNDGPLSTRHGFVAGSGAFDYAASGSGFHGQLINFTASNGPNWQPNDHLTFSTYQTRIGPSADMVRVLHVPSLFYGRQIVTGSVRLVCNSYSRQGLSRVLVDDGMGGLYVSGSITRPWGGQDYGGQRWNKVGNVFYTEGFVVVTDPSLLDFATVTSADWDGTTDILQASFQGSERVHTKILSCRLDTAQANASNNPTFSSRASSDPSDERFTVDDPSGPTNITGIGVYDRHRRLVAVVKLAQPIRKREKDRIVIRPKIDL